MTAKFWTTKFLIQMYKVYNMIVYMIWKFSIDDFIVSIRIQSFQVLGSKF